jgi:NitT/TauT family transport system permease protein
MTGISITNPPHIMLVRIVEPALWFAGLLAIWQILVRVLDVPVFILPAPSDFLYRIVTDHQRLLQEGWVTTRLVIYGFVAGALPGVILGYLIANVRLVEQLLYPLLRRSRSRR